MNRKIKILSYNIHKGFSGGLPKFTLHRLKEALQGLKPDLLFLQEVRGEHQGHQKRIKTYPRGSQFEYLAESLWPHFSYGKNAVYSEGHHGNAILSKFPILSADNIDISQNKIERRGILHALIRVPGLSQPLHALCVHLGLLGRHREKQIEQLARRIETLVPRNEAVIAAGDFNDWKKRVTSPLEKRLHLHETFFTLTGTHAKTFPNWCPLLSLDRVYVRGAQPLQAKCLDDPSWVRLSDHLALWVELEINC